jgi:ketosteroid isomerase-like protein
MAAIAIEDRLAVEDLYADYVWALDSGDVKGFLTLFTEDGVFGDTAGNRYKGHGAIGAYVTDLVNSERFRGRMHFISGKRFSVQGGRVGVTSYWLVTKWAKGSGAKTVEVCGHSDDAFVKVGGRWLFEQRIVHYWNDTELPWKAGPIT